jgi:hypothetical protein
MANTLRSLSVSPANTMPFTTMRRPSIPFATPPRIADHGLPGAVDHAGSIVTRQGFDYGADYGTFGYRVTP